MIHPLGTTIFTLAPLSTILQIHDHYGLKTLELQATVASLDHCGLKTLEFQATVASPDHCGLNQHLNSRSPGMPVYKPLRSLGTLELQTSMKHFSFNGYTLIYHYQPQMLRLFVLKQRNSVHCTRYMHLYYENLKVHRFGLGCK